MHVGSGFLHCIVWIFSSTYVLQYLYANDHNVWNGNGQERNFKIVEN